MRKKDNNLFNILLEDENVNFYTKMVIMLSMLDYYEDYYIPNIKLMKMLGINDISNTRRTLKKLEDENIIRLFYKGKRRYFSFIKYRNKKKLNNDKIDLFDYDWLNEE